MFEEMAIGVITVFEKHTREVVDDVLIRRYIQDYDMDCLMLSIECGCEKLVSSQILQRNLNYIWREVRTLDID